MTHVGVGALADRIAGITAIDVLRKPAQRLGHRVLAGSRRDFFQGVWMGEPLHPMLTDVTIGAWTSAFLLDIVGGRRSRRAARRLVGLGVLAAVPTAVAGASDWLDLGPEEQRVGMVHAGSNLVATGIYSWSYLARVRGRHGRGVAIGFFGAAIATVGGSLGGYLVYRRAAGVNHSIADEGPTEWTRTAFDPSPSGLTLVTVDDARVVVAEEPGGRKRAMGDRCSHQGGPLHEGRVDGDCIRCPWHDSAFRLVDGSVVAGPATSPQPTYEVHHSEESGLELRRVHP